MNWLKSDEAAVALGTSVSNLYVIAHRNRWKVIKAGKARLYSLADIESYLGRKKNG